ncbi:MAG: T9SS type A sorting domain-containing protein, partial [Candidatus Cloacimonetes bacterium]|nr:T9SS type A sorting domain-containing protein [Candidatus Cloacimonadota bacterium]
VYPNPFKDQLSLQFDNKAPQRLQVAVYDIRGRLIDQQDLGYLQAGNQTISWDGKNNPAGVYLLRIQGSQTQIMQKVIKM